MKPTFGKTITEEPNEDGTTKITERGYYRGQERSMKVTIRQDIDTNKTNLFKDLLTCLDELKTTTPDLTIVIKKDRYGQPFLIQKSWTIISKYEKK